MITRSSEKSENLALTDFTERSCIMRSQKRINRYYEEPEQLNLSKLLSGVGEDMLRRIVVSIVLATPGIRSSFIKLLMTSFLLGVGATLVLLWKVPWLFTWLSTR